MRCAVHALCRACAVRCLLGAMADEAVRLAQESEGEEAAEARVALPQDMGRGNLAARQSRVRLQEIGPRMELEVVKVSAASCSMWSPTSASPGTT